MAGSSHASLPNPARPVVSPTSPDSPTYDLFPTVVRNTPRMPEPIARTDFHPILRTPPPPAHPLPSIPTTPPKLSPPGSSMTHTRNTSTGTTSTLPSSITRKVYTQPPKHIAHGIRERSHDYQRLRERPSVPLLSTDGKSIRSRSGSTKSAPAGPCISIVTGKGSNLHSIATAPVVPTLPTRYGRVPTPVGCFPGRVIKVEDWGLFAENNNTTLSGSRGDHGRPRWDIPDGCFGPGQDEDAKRKQMANNNGILGGVKHKFRNMLRGLHVSVSISFKEKEMVVEEDDDYDLAPRPRQTKRNMTLRIKNNRSGSCIFEIIKLEDSGDEILTPINDLRSLFPYSKHLQKGLLDWNHHFQNPPQHWVMNFIPRAYLKRGYTLSEDVCEYFSTHSDGCSYRIEYEPIGHHFCHVGTTKPSRLRRRSRRGGDMWWDSGREKYLSFVR